MKSNALRELYAKLPAAASPEADPSLLPDSRREAGHFNVFTVADLMLDYRNRPPMTFDRREFYKISLIRGRSRIEYADRVIDVDGPALWLATHRVPYRWLPHDLAQTGYFCVFTDEFLLPAKSGIVPDDLSFFQPGGQAVLLLTNVDYARIEVIFEKMVREITSAYTYKYDLLRAYLVELIHAGQKLQPAPIQTPVPNASARVTAQFTTLLERQFPIESPQQRLRLRSANEYADHLSVHVNHLNRVLKETTGQTTTGLIGERVGQEARMLLKQTNWTVSEIANSLGFADAAHFCNFFKRQTGLVPGAFRD